MEGEVAILLTRSKNGLSYLAVAEEILKESGIAYEIM